MAICLQLELTENLDLGLWLLGPSPSRRISSGLSYPTWKMGLGTETSFAPILLLLFCYAPHPTPEMSITLNIENSVNFAGTCQSSSAGSGFMPRLEQQVEEHLTPKSGVSLPACSLGKPSTGAVRRASRRQGNRAGPESIHRRLTSVEGSRDKISIFWRCQILHSPGIPGSQW